MSPPMTKSDGSTPDFLKPGLNIAGANRATIGNISNLPLAPDLTDKALAKQRTTATMLAGAGMGRRSTFLASQMGEPLLGSKTTLGGF